LDLETKNVLKDFSGSATLFSMFTTRLLEYSWCSRKYEWFLLDACSFTLFSWFARKESEAQEFGFLAKLKGIPANHK